MGTLRQLKLKMKLDRDLRKTLVRGGRNEILIDLDGDKEADIIISDMTGDGDADTIGIDLNGNGEFDLYFKDTNHNGVPDLVLIDDDEDGILRPIAAGDEVEDEILRAIGAVSQAIAAGDYIASVLDERLDELDKEVKAARKALKKARR